MDRTFRRGDEILKIAATSAGETITLVTENGDRTYHWAELSPGEYLLRENGRQRRVVVARAGKDRWVWIDGHVHCLQVVTGARRRRSEEEGSLLAPMNGLVLKVLTAAGQRVKKKQPLVVLEAMKMQYEIAAPCDGTVATVNCQEGEQVQGGVALVHLEEEKKAG